jgi:tape measure domain-containing protein
LPGATMKVGLLALGSGGVGAAFLKSAGDLQITSKSFEVLTGNVEVANKLFGQLATYANNTPFQFPQIADAGRVLLGYGITTKDVYKDIQMLGDLASVTGADFKSLAVVFGQVNATGKLMGQDSLQLINNNIPITTILAKRLGESVQQVKQDMSDGKISADIFNAALESTTAKGGFAFHGTDVLAQTLNGRISTLTDAVMEFGRELLGVKVDPKLGLVVESGGLFDKISNAIPKMIEGLKQITPVVQGAFMFLLDHGDLVLAVLAGMAAAFVVAEVAAIAFGVAAAIAMGPLYVIPLLVTVVVGAIAALAVMIYFHWDKITAVTKNMVSSVSGVFAQLTDVVSSFFKYFQVMFSKDSDYGNDWLGHLPEAIQPAVMAMGQFIAIIQQFGNIWHGFVEAFQTDDAGLLQSALFKVGLESLTDPLGRFAGFLRDTIESIQDTFTNMLKSTEKIFTTMLSFLRGVGITIGRIVLDWASPYIWLYNNVIEPITLLITAILFRSAAGWYQVFDALDKRILAVESSILGSIISLNTFIVSLENKLIADLIGIGKLIFDAMTVPINMAKDFIVNGIIAMKNEVVGNWNSLIGFLNSARNAIVDAMTGPINTAHSGIVNTINGIMNFVSSSWNNIVNFFRGLSSSIVNAITQPFEDAKKGIENIAGQIRKAANEINPFVKHSPSLVENVQEGIGIIRKEYESLGRISIAPITHQYAPAVARAGTLQSGSVSKTQNITVHIASIKDKSDIDSLVRELGYKSSL